MTKITGSDNTLLQTDRLATERSAEADRAGKAADRAGKTAAAASSTATASLSGTGSVLAQAVGSTDDVRTEKIAALKAAIDSGSYNVPAEKVADKLMDGMLG